MKTSNKRKLKRRRKRPIGTRRRILDKRDHVQLLTIVAQLQHGYSLSTSQSCMAGNLLGMLAHDIDARDLFYKTVVGVKPDANHWDIALHYLLLLESQKGRGSSKAAKGKVAQAWGYADSAIPRIVRRHRSSCVEIVTLANPKTRIVMMKDLEARAKEAKTK